MSDPHLLLHRVNLLEGPGRPSRIVDALISGQRLQALAEPGALAVPLQGRCQSLDAQTCWLAPPLVDPHSVLDDPYLGRAETLKSLQAAAAAGGYGTVALLPWARAWRDRPERLVGLGWPAPMQLHLWGSFCLEGQDRDLAGHGDQLAAGAIGLAAGDSLPPLGLLERGLSLAEMADKPILLPMRDNTLCRDGFVRERVQALRAGWPVDPALSEILPLQTLLTLAGRGLVLPLLWQELVCGHGWEPTLLWERLCWGPARFLGLAAEALLPGSQRWLLFDAEKCWLWQAQNADSLAANQPWLERPMVGQVVASGLTAATEWLVPGFPSC